MYLSSDLTRQIWQDLGFNLTRQRNNSPSHEGFASRLATCRTGSVAGSGLVVSRAQNPSAGMSPRLIFLLGIFFTTPSGSLWVSLRHGLVCRATKEGMDRTVSQSGGSECNSTDHRALVLVCAVLAERTKYFLPRQTDGRHLGFPAFSRAHPRYLGESFFVLCPMSMRFVKDFSLSNRRHYN